MVAVLLTAAALAGPPDGCAATVVRYDTAVPRAGTVSLANYVRTLRDGRVNGSDELVLWRVGAKLVWRAKGLVKARRLDAPGTFRTRREVLRFPATGCWRLSAGGRSVVARVVGNPPKLGCDVTELVGGAAYARPRATGIRGPWPWLPIAELSTHGHDGDRNMKIPWWVHRNWGPTLELRGTRLDAPGAFMQEFVGASTHDGPQDEMVFPSIVDIPAAGCWLLRLRTAKLAGVLVVRATDARG